MITYGLLNVTLLVESINLFTIKPGLSFWRTGKIRFPWRAGNFLHTSCVIFTVVSEVSFPLIISINRRITIGVKKWHPMTLSGFQEEDAIFVMLIVEVFVAIIACSGLNIPNLVKRSCLRSKISGIASIIKSAWDTAFFRSVSFIRFSIKLGDV